MEINKKTVKIIITAIFTKLFNNIKLINKKNLGNQKGVERKKNTYLENNSKKQPQYYCHYSRKEKGKEKGE